MELNESGSSKILVDKLSGMEDFHVWKFRMKMILIHDDLFDCVSANKEGQAECSDRKKQEKALAKICLSVQPSVYSHVRNCTTAFEAWKNLSKVFEGKGLCRRLGLLRQLFNLKYCQFENMAAYLRNVMDVAQQLRDIDAALEDEFVAIIMLSGLPKYFDPLIMTLEHSSVPLSSDIVKTKLLQESQRRQDEDSPDVSAEEKVLATAKGPRKCFRCGKAGHYARNCSKNESHKAKKPSSVKQPLETKEGLMLSGLSANVNSKAWYVDSGASCHMCNNKSILHNYVEDSSLHVMVANGQKLASVGRGDTTLFVEDGVRTLGDVVFIPQLSCNLISVNTLTQRGYCVNFDRNICKILRNNVLVAIAKRVESGLYKLQTHSVSANSAMRKQNATPLRASATQNKFNSHTNTNVKQETQGVWHRRLGHLNSRSMNLLRGGMVSGINYDPSTYEQCIACIEGKCTKLPFPKKSTSRAKEVLGLVHTDVCCMPVTSLGGAKYLLTFIDDFSRKTFCFCIDSKDKVFECFKQFKALVENETGKKIKILRSDGGGEYINTRFRQYLEECGIRHHTTVPHCPQQNSVAERANRTIVEAVRCMLLEAGLDQRFWAEAAKTAVYIKNRSPTKAVRGITPEECFTGQKVNISNFRIFGCVAYAVQEKRKKLDAKCKSYIFVGYCENTKGFRLLDSKSLKLTIARNVKFLENKFLKHLEGDKSNVQNVDAEPITFTLDPQESEQITESVSADDISEVSFSGSNNDHSSDVTFAPAVSYDSDDSRAAVEELDNSFFTTFLTGEACGNDEPKTYQEAISGEEAKHWRAAIKDEYQSFLDNKCFTLSDLPMGVKPVKTKWIFKKKRGLNGELLQYKARLVAKGFTQRHGVDYFETYSPVVRYETLRMLLAIAAEYNMEVEHMDVKTAFLNGDLKETVYMEIPEGFNKDKGKNRVYCLRKAVYGLKQAPKAWNEKINQALVNKLKFKRLYSEPCVYVKKNDDKLVIIALYVDDVFLFSNCQIEKKKTKQLLMKEFEMKDLGPAENKY